jgi:hypothetical protein
MVEDKCPLHDGIVEWLREGRTERKEIIAKLDKLIERESVHHEELVCVRGIVSDGLQSNVKDICTEVKAINEKIVVLDDFKKSLDWLVSLRDHTFKTVLWIAILGGAAYSFIHFGSEVVGFILK